MINLLLQNNINFSAQKGDFNIYPPKFVNNTKKIFFNNEIY